MDKKIRLLAIFYRLATGEEISVKKIAGEFEVSTKSILRDISKIRDFLAETSEWIGNLRLVYSKKENAYWLEGRDSICERDVFFIIKVLLGSKALDKQNMSELLSRLIGQLPDAAKKKMQDIANSDLSGYKETGGWNVNLSEKIWNLEKVIRSGKAISVVYGRLDGKKVERKLYPLSISFSEYYFYLLALRADVDKSAVVYYRIDRIQEYTVENEKIPLDIEERRKKEAERLYAQNMYMGEKLKIRFRYTGQSVQAVLDKFPTAEIVEQNEMETLISAVVEYSHGTVMELLSQGKWIQVLYPDRVVNDIKKEAEEILRHY